MTDLDRELDAMADAILEERRAAPGRTPTRSNAPEPAAPPSRAIPWLLALNAASFFFAWLASPSAAPRSCTTQGATAEAGQHAPPPHAPPVSLTAHATKRVERPLITAP
ncbi:MAG TPA: hypothetical protein VFS00_05465 [Polyangiaceae bacterium]|nr:hypothetical protein [Polyangiaceae bacterium]